MTETRWLGVAGSDERSPAHWAPMAGYEVVVVELDDPTRAGAEATSSFWVTVTARDGERWLQRAKKRGTPPLVAERGGCLRPDLRPRKRRFDERQAAERAARAARDELRRSGHTVNGRYEEYRVYVIELGDGARRHSDGKRPLVYVGQSALSPTARFNQHKAAARRANGQKLYSNVVHRHGIALVPELYDHVAPAYIRADALALERATWDELVRVGYAVRGGT